MTTEENIKLHVICIIFLVESVGLYNIYSYAKVLANSVRGIGGEEIVELLVNFFLQLKNIFFCTIDGIRYM